MKLKVFLLLLSLPILAAAQDKMVQGIQVQGQPGLKLQGTLKSVAVEQDRSGHDITVALHLELTNTGVTPIILWKRDGHPVGGKSVFLYTGYTLCRAADCKSENVLDTRRFMPSLSGAPEWADVRITLNQPAPPAEVTTILSPGQNLSFDSDLIIHSNPRRTDSIPEHPTFAELKEAGTFWLRVHFDTWSSDIEPNPRSLKMEFGRALRTRWKDFGYLWLDEIYSEPIQLNLKG